MMIQKKEYFRLKTAVVKVIIPILFLFACDKNGTDPYMEVVFNNGLPESLKPHQENLPFENFRYANLKTGSDSLQVMFGTFQQGSTKGHWIATISGGLPTFSTISLEENDSLEYRTKDIEIEFNEYKNRVSLRIIEMDSITNKIKYSWLNDSGLSDKLVVKKIEKPLRRESKFPEMNFESLSGEQVSSRQFDGNFVVINWWATWCAPCIKEIPGLNAIVERYSNRDDVRFIAITNEPKSKIINFLKHKNFKYEMTFADSEVQTLFGKSYPVNIIIDPSGIITYLNEGAGPNTPSEIENSLSEQLAAYIERKRVHVD